MANINIYDNSVYNTDLSILIYLLNFILMYLIISTWSNNPLYPQLKQQMT